MFALGLYIASFIIIWLGAGFIINGVDSFAKKLKISSFAISFFILGILTSIPETSVGLTAIANNDPEIYVGTLLGGVITMFLLVIPTLAILGNGIKIQSNLDNGPLLLSLLVTMSPSILIADKHISKTDSLIMLTLYIILFFFMQKKQGVLEALKKQMTAKKKVNYTKNFFLIIVGIVMVYYSGNLIVDNTLYFAELLHVTPFVISLLVLSIGTNLPELSLAIKSILSGKKDIAFGDYIGSAAANTLLFALLSLLYGGSVNINGNFYITFFFIVCGLSLFYYFSRSKRNISRKEGFMLFGLYIVFLFVELFKNNII
ncbi:MAG TPA: sodium:calcium antiporter [Candidatus Woesebacteria bacterium]|nr:sodium:calcium antiporter [Candidatus Woesebacteria bacterium]